MTQTENHSLLFNNLHGLILSDVTRGQYIVEVADDICQFAVSLGRVSR